MTPREQIGILLLNWNNEENINRHIHEMACWNSRPSIIIVDNASKTDISSIIDNSDEVTIIRSQINQGFSGGNNLGFRHFIKEDYEYVLLLNHDADLLEESFHTLLDVMKRDMRIGVIGPRIQEGMKWYAGGRNIAHHPITRILYTSSGQLLRQVDYLPGSACLIRISSLKKVGLFDERYFFSGEMADLCLRIRKAGYTCVVHTGVESTHNSGQDTPIRERIHLYYSLRNRFLYIRKHERYLLVWMIFWIIFSFILAIGVIIQKKPHSAKAALLGVRDGLIGRFGDRNGYFIH